MAGIALKKLEEELKCPICLDTYTDPRVLQCYHIYCQQCLTSMVVRDQQGQLSLTCPTCHQNTTLPATGVADLQPAHHINPLLKVMEEHRKAKEINHDGAAHTPRAAETVKEKPRERAETNKDEETVKKKPKSTVETQNEEETVKEKPKSRAETQNEETVKEKPKASETQAAGGAKDNQYCSVHTKKELNLYCETCEELTCYRCALKGGKHYKHDCQELNEAYEKFKKEIASSLEPMEKKLTSAKKALREFDTRTEEITSQEVSIEADIHSTVSELHKILEDRQKELLSQLNQITEGKLQDLDAQRKLMERTHAQLKDCLDFVQENPGQGNQGQVLMRLQPDVLEIKTEADVGFSVSDELAAVVQSYGEVSLADPADPSQCRITGRGLETAVVGEPSTALLEAVDTDGKPYERTIQSLECELVSEITDARVRGSIERRGQSQYEISYQPTIKGRHQLHIKISGRHIRGSPFSVTVKLPLELFGTPMQAFGEVNTPAGVAINQKGEVLVSEGNRHCVSVFSASGKKLQSIGTRGIGKGQFEHPRGVAVDGEGNLLVADTNNHRIQKLTPDGRFLAKAHATDPLGPIRLTYPRGIAFNTANNKVYIVDANDRVLVLNSDLTFHFNFGDKGNGSGQFERPSGIACDGAGKVYVADSWNNRVQVFAADKKFLKVIGPGCGDGRGELKSPSGVAVDTSGMVYVSDCNDQIFVFTPEGECVTSFACARARGEAMSSLCGLAVDSTGVLYVCDSHKSIVEMF